MLLKACLNGARDVAEHPRLSADVHVIAAEARAAVDAGAGALHVHAKDAVGRDSLVASDVARVVEAVHSACPGVPVGVTTGAWALPDVSARVAAVSAWTVRPDFASVNWHEDGADEVAGALLDLGIGVEAGLWNAEGLQRWAVSPHRDASLRVLIELPDVPAHDAAGHVDRLAAPLLDGVRRAAPDLPVLLHGEDASAWPAIDLALREGLDTRVGLEDTLHLPDGRPAHGNGELVWEAARRLWG
ncbi:3-keto-5-aminohexanoate cleavage protein [Kytococcus schroeteri]|uniref:3-keto-5-aminohexanoate cleavage protein n=1 Tax=Kytococcus schroeteri TaxID=138300 RepID=UPI0011424855|nr:3-keto-5-aminohexanoate cleavage protein [Kytococcus schroeteri]